MGTPRTSSKLGRMPIETAQILMEHARTAPPKWYNKRSEERTDPGALALYERMKRQGVNPSICVAQAALKACRSLRDFKQGRRIHKDLLQTGDCSDITVSNILVSLYARCGSMRDAREAFESMQFRDVVSWNSIIQGYAQSGNVEQALRLYACMLVEGGCKPDRVTFLAALKACSKLLIARDGKNVDKPCKAKCLENVRAVHRDATRFSFEKDLFVASTLIDLYAKCGAMEQADKIFHGMPHKSVVTWNCIIIGHADNGNASLALELFELMQQRGFSPDGATFLAAFKACSSLAEHELGQEMDGQIVKANSLQKARVIHSKAGENLEENFLANTLVDLYAKCGSTEESRMVFDSMHHRDTVSWNCLIMGYVDNGKPGRALELYTQMQHAGNCPVDRVTVLAALKSCASLGEAEQGQVIGGSLVKLQSLEKGRSIHIQATKFLGNPDLFVENTLIDMYAKCGSMREACSVLRGMRHRNVISWTGILLGYSNRGESMQAIHSFEDMLKDGVSPDHVTCTTTIKAYASLAEAEQGELLDRKIIKVKSLNKGKALHLQIASFGLDTELCIASLLIDMYAKCRSTASAQEVFEKIKNKDVVLWNCMIFAFESCGESASALEHYFRMKEEGFVPGSGTYVGVLKACASLTALESGRGIHRDIRSAGLHADPAIGSCLINFYGRCGCLDEAEDVFRLVSSKTIVLWSALIGAYSVQGNTQRVFDLFESMQKDRALPDSVTYLSILTACTHSGLVEEGKLYFEEMSVKYGLPRDIQHYTCMVDLLGRANRLNEALRLIEEMPFEADAVIWTTVLDSCRRWKNVSIGRHAFQSVLGLDHRVMSAYVLMASIYTGTGNFEEAAEVEAMSRRASEYLPMYIDSNTQ